MSVQTATATKVAVEWDDSVMFVFSFYDSGNTQYFAGFQRTGVQVQSGTSTQVSKIQQNVAAVQVSNDPQTWIETVKNAARNSSAQLAIVFDDSTSTPFTTLTSTNFSLQLLYSIAG
jgi:hypothetical protein